jgi:excinuclease ABC subunit A
VLYELKLTPEPAAGAAATAARPRKAARPTPDAIREALVSLRKRGFNRLYQGGACFEFSTPEELLDVDFSKSRCTCWWTGWRYRRKFVRG